MLTSEKKATSLPRKIPPYPKNTKFGVMRPSQTDVQLTSPLLESRNISDRKNEKFSGILV